MSKNANKQIGQMVKDEGFRGVFPWAANYDAVDPKDQLIQYVGMGLGLVPDN